jgi:chaperonin GroES
MWHDQKLPLRDDNMNIKPIGKRALIKPVKEEEKTAGGIYLPESAKEKRKQGIVVDIGKPREDMPIASGDMILYTGYSAEEFEVDGEKYIIVDYSDIIAKLE